DAARKARFGRQDDAVGGRVDDRVLQVAGRFARAGMDEHHALDLLRVDAVDFHFVAEDDDVLSLPGSTPGVAHGFDSFTEPKTLTAFGRPVVSRRFQMQGPASGAGLRAGAGRPAPASRATG